MASSVAAAIEAHLLATLLGITGMPVLGGAARLPFTSPAPPVVHTDHRFKKNHRWWAKMLQNCHRNATGPRATQLLRLTYTKYVLEEAGAAGSGTFLCWYQRCLPPPIKNRSKEGGTASTG